MKNRGMFLESIINKTISFYLENEIAVFHKKELPISFNKVNLINNKLKIENAYIKNKSKVDYYGIYNGSFVAFEAKSTNLDNLPLKNIKNHQHEYLKLIKRLNGIVFYIICFKRWNEFYLINIETIDNLEKKQLDIDIARKKGIQLELEYPGIIDFVKFLE
ncbi:MAG: Holliday junction resolvase RecU [Mycoplasma sp.]|nr:Holliday junction resolvase RecU [Mycoplasma sp.]